VGTGHVHRVAAAEKKKKAMPEWIIVVVDGLLMVCILGGNCLTITVIVKKPRLATPSNQFVLGLALADMLVRMKDRIWSQLFFVLQ
jgi:hypothetical protein